MGYDPDRFDAIDSFWSCHICAHILKEPTLICSSDHVICRDCVPLATMCPWPTCDEKVFDGGFRIDTNMARFLIITCDECDWRGPVSAERDHVTKCEYRRVQCSNENCTEVVLLGSMADHLLQCSAALVPCINSPACTYLGQRSEIAQHRLCCVFFPCRWREAGCDFRGSSVTMGAHELYCTDLHNKLGNLRAAVDRLITENITLRSRGHKVEDCANPGVCPEDVEIVDSNASTGKHQKKRRLRSQVDVDAMPLPELELISTQLDDPIKVKKAKKREKHRGEARLEEEADTLQAIAAEEKRIRREEKAKRRERRKEVRMLAEKAKEICTTAENEQRRPLAPVTAAVDDIHTTIPTTGITPSSSLPSPANSIEHSVLRSKVHGKDSIASNYASPPLNRLPDHLGQEGSMSEASARFSPERKVSKGHKHAIQVTPSPTVNSSVIQDEITTPAQQQSSMRKRGRDEAGLDAGVGASVKQKKVRIRLPSPFLQPDTDEDGAKGGEVRDASPENLSGHDDSDMSEEYGDLVVTQVSVREVPGMKNGKDGGEVEVEETLAPTPASLLARYQASKPLCSQRENVSPSVISLPATFSQQYLDFPMPLSSQSLHCLSTTDTEASVSPDLLIKRSESDYLYL